MFGAEQIRNGVNGGSTGLALVAGTNRIFRKQAFFNSLFEVVPAAELGRFPGPVMVAAEAGATSLDALIDATVQFIEREWRL